MKPNELTTANFCQHESQETESMKRLDSWAHHFGESVQRTDTLLERIGLAICETTERKDDVAPTLTAEESYRIWRIATQEDAIESKSIVIAKLHEIDGVQPDSDITLRYWPTVGKFSMTSSEWL